MRERISAWRCFCAVAEITLTTSLTSLGWKQLRNVITLTCSPAWLAFSHSSTQLVTVPYCTLTTSTSAMRCCDQASLFVSWFVCSLVTVRTHERNYIVDLYECPTRKLIDGGRWKGTCPSPQNLEKYFTGNYHVKLGHFSANIIF